MSALRQSFIEPLALPVTSRVHPHIRCVSMTSRPDDLVGRVGWFPAAGDRPKAVYVLFVGTAEAIEKHGPAIADVQLRGNDVLVFEFPGQGRSGRFSADPNKVHVPPGGFEMWTDSVGEFLRSDIFNAVRKRARVAELPMVALGYSLGGHLLKRALQVSPEMSRRFTHIVYVNPVVAMNSGRSMLLRLIQSAIVWRRVTQKGASETYLPGHGRFDPCERPLEKSRIGSDRARHDWVCNFYRENPELTMWGTTHGWFHEANSSVRKMWSRLIRDRVRRGPLTWFGLGRAKRAPADFVVADDAGLPTLVISSQRDEIVIAHYVQKFARLIGADLLLLPTAKHEPSQEPTDIREGTFSAVAAWVRAPHAPDIPTSQDVQFRAAA